MENFHHQGARLFARFLSVTLDQLQAKVKRFGVLFLSDQGFGQGELQLEVIWTRRRCRPRPSMSSDDLLLSASSALMCSASGSRKPRASSSSIS